MEYYCLDQIFLQTVVQFGCGLGLIAINYLAHMVWLIMYKSSSICIAMVVNENQTKDKLCIHLATAKSSKPVRAIYTAEKWLE